MDRVSPAGALVVILAATLLGCVRDGGGDGLALSSPDRAPAPTSDARYPVSGGRFHAAEAVADLDPIAGRADESSSSGVVRAIDAAFALSWPAREPWPTSEPVAAGGPPSPLADADVHGDGEAGRDRPSSGGLNIARTEPRGTGDTVYSRDNPQAADLLDHWGHRRVQSIVEGLSLGTAAAVAAGDGTPAAPAGAGRLLAGELEDGSSEVRLLGSGRGVTYGRWTGGWADSLPIDFNYSRAGSILRRDPAFRVLLERAGKSWSRRIADTWPTWERVPGDIKGYLLDENNNTTAVRIGSREGTVDSLEIYVRDDDIRGGFAGRGGGSGPRPTIRPWEPRFGSVKFDRGFLKDDPLERYVSETIVHEIGHVLGAWFGENSAQEHTEPLVDRAAGTWRGPNVVAVHGRPAPFQDRADPHAWVNGERSPTASEYDFSHSGVCSSIMAYCGDNDPQTAFVPHAIDYAFLADVGMTVTDETDRPETYGLAGWTEHAGFSISVSRDLEIDLSDNLYRGRLRYSRPFELDVTDRLRAEVDTFGSPTLGDILQSFPVEDLQGTVRYSGGLLGAAIGRPDLPPVTGNASLAVNLGTFAGEASFTSLTVYPEGIPATFAGGSRDYPFELSGNAITGTGSGATLRASFYGPRHEGVAGTLRDPTVGLLASFGVSHDDGAERVDADEPSPSQEEVAGETRQGPERVDADEPSQEEVAGEIQQLDTILAGSSDVEQARPAESGTVTAWAPTVEQDDTLHIGADAAPALDDLVARPDYGGVAVSSGRVRDGTGAARVVEYLKQQIGATYRSVPATAGLPTYSDVPTVRLARGTSKEFAGYVEQAVQLVNTVLPAGKQIRLGSEPAPPRTALGNVPEGEIFVDFATSVYDLDLLGGRYIFSYSDALVAVLDPIVEYNPETQRWEFDGMRAGRLSFDHRALETRLNTAWVQDERTQTWEKQVLPNRVVESDTVQHYFPRDQVVTMTVYTLFRSLGFLRNVDHSVFPDSMVQNRGFGQSTNHLPGIDGDALLAAYGRLAAGTQPEDLTVGSLGPWEDTSFHLRGDLDLAGGGDASFGVAIRNGVFRPWASGALPLATLEDNSALFGTVRWDGALLGLTPSAETVAGKASMTVELRTLDGRLDFSGLESWGVKAAPRGAGTGTTWGDGDLAYSIEIDGNSFRRAGGDDGEVVGSFFGSAHEAMGGVLERSDLSAAFGGVR